MEREIIRFTFKGKRYEFSRPYDVKTHEGTSLKWIHECYASIGAKPKQITNRSTTMSSWNFWCGYIA